MSRVPLVNPLIRTVHQARRRPRRLGWCGIQVRHSSCPVRASPQPSSGPPRTGRSPPGRGHCLTPVTRSKPSTTHRVRTHRVRFTRGSFSVRTSMVFFSTRPISAAERSTSLPGMPQLAQLARLGFGPRVARRYQGASPILPSGRFRSVWYPEHQR